MWSSLLKQQKKPNSNPYPYPFKTNRFLCPAPQMSVWKDSDPLTNIGGDTWPTFLKLHTLSLSTFRQSPVSSKSHQRCGCQKTEAPGQLLQSKPAYFLSISCVSLLCLLKHFAGAFPEQASTSIPSTSLDRKATVLSVLLISCHPMQIGSL